MIFDNQKFEIYQQRINHQQRHLNELIEISLSKQQQLIPLSP